METYELYFLAFKIIQALFVFAFGACVGSLINVLVYRLPLGISVITPPSRCPSCNTKLTWRENIPIFGWIFLKGRCRFCKSKISAEYPIVEAFTACTFVLFFVLWYLVPDNATVLGVHIGAYKPEWAMSGIGETWPTLLVVLCLVSSLIAMTLTDLKTFMIPLVLTWTPAIFALFVHPIHAAFIQHFHGSFDPNPGVLNRTAPGEIWAIPTPGPNGWWWIGASIGGSIGLVIANVLLHFGLIRRSFADYEAWEQQALAEQAAAAGRGAAAPATSPAAESASAADPTTAGSTTPAPAAAAAPTSPSSAEHASELWIAYPHARREMLKELVFLAPCLALALLGGALARHLAGPWRFDPNTFSDLPAHQAPLWLSVLAGVLMGYLIGGGIVWGVRILGSLGFGKEAVGLGDVHLLAAVGACVGWIDSILSFFGAAFVGLAFHVIRSVSAGKLKRTMPFGPSLAIATVLVLLLKPLLERLLTLIANADPPFNFP
jgi:leader peptidase (prepilin peptidase) / N-methyltransferase